MPAIELSELSSSLTKHLFPIYAVHGEETLLMLETIDHIRKAAQLKGYIERNRLDINGQLDETAFTSVTSRPSLFAQQLFLEVHFSSDKLGIKGSDVLQHFIQSPPEQTLTLLVFPTIDRAQQKNSWFAALQQSTGVIEAKPITKKILPHWIEQRLLKQQQSPTADALHFMVSHVEGNLLAAQQEIDKLALLYPPGEITLDTVRSCIGYAARFSVFDLADAWMGQEIERSLRILTELQAQGEALTLVLWVVIDDIRKLIKLRQGLTQNRPMSDLERELRLWGSKKVLAQSAVKRLGTLHLTKALNACADIDRQIKGVEEGEPWQALQNILLQLAT